MNYLTAPWVKLYCRPDADWVRLPLSVRGLGSESLKYASEDGFLVDTEGEPLGVALGCFMGARPAEHKRLQDDAEKLLAHGFYEMRGTRVYIRNFVDAQTRRSPAAARQARKRERDRAEASEVIPGGTEDESDMSRDMSRGGSHAMSRGIDPIRSNRSDRIDVTPAASHPAKARKRAAHAIPTALDGSARTVLEKLNEARQRIEPASRGLAATSTNLRHIADRLAEGHAVDDLLHVIAVGEAESKRDPSKLDFLNAVTPFRPDNFARKVGGSVEPLRSLRAVSGAARSADDVLADAFGGSSR